MLTYKMLDNVFPLEEWLSTAIALVFLLAITVVAMMF
jgi:hypothetical protein